MAWARFFCHTFDAIIDLVCSSSETYAYENSNICDSTFERLAEEKRHLVNLEAYGGQQLSIALIALKKYPEQMHKCK